MTTILEKLKRLGASMKKTTKSTAKTIVEKTPEVTDKAKEIVSAVAEKTEEAVSHTKLRHKLYTLNKSVEKRFGELGGFVFDLLSQGKLVVYEDSDVKGIVGAIEHIKKEIKETEKEIEGRGTEKKEEKK